MLESISRTALFAGFAEERMKDIAAFSRKVTYAAGDHAIVEGSAEQHPDLLLLLEGEVDVEMRFSYLPMDGVINLKTIGGEVFGEIAWLLGDKRSASVKCKRHCQILIIDGSRLTAFCKAHPAEGLAIMSRIAHLLARRVVDLSKQLKNRELLL